MVRAALPALKTEPKEKRRNNVAVDEYFQLLTSKRSDMIDTDWIINEPFS